MNTTRDQSTFPKSTLHLKPGDYWSIPREDGRYGFLVYLGPPPIKPDSRTGLVTAVLNYIQNEENLEPNGPIFSFLRTGMLHVKTFQETKVSIRGNILSRLNRGKVKEALENHNPKNPSARFPVWGYLLPLKLVNDVSDDVGTKVRGPSTATGQACLAQDDGV